MGTYDASDIMSSGAIGLLALTEKGTHALMASACAIILFSTYYYPIMLSCRCPDVSWSSCSLAVVAANNDGNEEASDSGYSIASKI